MLSERVKATALQAPTGAVQEVLQDSSFKLEDKLSSGHLRVASKKGSGLSVRHPTRCRWLMYTRQPRADCADAWIRRGRSHRTLHRA